MTMASSSDRQSPLPGLIPPPAAAPRRRSPVLMSPESNPDEPRPPPIPARPTEAANIPGPGVDRRGNYCTDDIDINLRQNVDDVHGRKTSAGKSQSMFAHESSLNPFSEHYQHISTTHHPDLVGLDFSTSSAVQAEDSRPRSLSLEDLKDNQRSIYPDIRHVFRDVASSQSPSPTHYAGNQPVGQKHLLPAHLGVRSCSTPPPMPTHHPGGYGSQSPSPTQWVINQPVGQKHLLPAQIGVQACSSPPPVPTQPSGGYGWNPFLLAPSAFPPQPSRQSSGFLSVPYPASELLSAARMEYGGSYATRPDSFGFQNNNFNAFGNRPNLSWEQQNASAAYDANPLNSGTSSSINYVPNITFLPPAEVPCREPSQSPTDNQMHPIIIAGFDENLSPSNSTPDLVPAGDLIKLGLTLPEHEYLSLDYFDPLYSRARRESVSLGTSSTADLNFSFGEAFPNIYDDHTNLPSAVGQNDDDDDVWSPRSSMEPSQQDRTKAIGFEAFDFDSFGDDKFGKSEQEFMKEVLPPTFTSAAYDAPAARKKPDDAPRKALSWAVPQGKKYERLRKRTFIDAESESFCQMVADLKKRYLSTDEKTNLGYLINQTRECHVASIQVKVVVHTKFFTDPISFTCDTSALVEHVISHVLCMLSPTDGQINTDKFILKVYDRSEYLSNDLPLAKFEYTHSCLKVDRDICLELVSIEEVSRPFIRTRDDDAQILYFPKEYINADGTAVSQNALTVYIDTFYHEVDVLLEHFTQSSHGAFSMKALLKSVTAVCYNLAKVETVEITKTLEKLQRNVSELASPSSKIQGMYGKSRDKETQDAINVALRCSLVEDLKETMDQLVEAVKRLVKMYCQTFLTDFYLGSSVVIPHDHLEVVQLQEYLIVCLSSAHRIPAAWANQFEDYKIVCSLYHGTKRLAPDVSTSLKGLSKHLCERICWDEWLQFDKTHLCTLPRETRLCLMLCGTRSTTGTGDKVTDKGDVTSESKKVTYPLGAAAIQLFNEKGYLNQGPQLVPLMMGVSSDPIMPSCKTLLPDSVLLQVNLPDFERTIFFPEPLNAATSPTRSFDLLSPQLRTMVTNVMEKESCLSFSAEELEILWTYRHYMTAHPSLLPRILQAAVSWDWASLSEIYALLRVWKPLRPIQAFELLLPQFPDLRVRQFAADSLNKIPTDDLIDFLPQMIQGLKFESYHNSPLAKLLLEQSCKSPRFAHQFFWLLKGAASQDATFKRRYELMFVALASVAGDALYQEFKKQEELVKIMTSVAEKVKEAKDKDVTLKQELVSLHQMVERKGRLLLPYNPSVEVVGLDMKSCSYFTSNAFPLKLVFRNSNPRADSHYVIYKVGDDLRQDMLTLQMIRIMDNLWLQQGLDLKMITFACLATGPKKGVIELITESETLRKIQVSCGVTGSFKDRPIKEWLQKHNPTELEYKKAVENFTYSCAGYCVATYVLGICDRHNDNIMLKQSGHMFHIDFSKFLGDAQMFGSFKRDRVPFVLTSDMAYVINDGARPGHRFQHFIDLCCQAFNILRKHADLFRSLFILMIRSGIPGVTEHAVQYVQTTLLPGCSEAQATATFTRMIEESMKSVFTQFNFFIHNLAQLKFSSHSEGALLSFVPKAYSAASDGRISSVELFGYQKRYTPEKHYIFILKIERVNQKVPTYIFRHFSEFVELRDKLNYIFPLLSWPNFSTRVVIGRSTIRSVAESRKTEIGNFLRFLWGKTAEISQCELVYTFFHPLLRDEQEAEKANLKMTKVREPLIGRTTNGGNSGIQGEIKLSIQFKKNALQVMVMHVRGLAEGSQLPSPYVKTYLLPDPDKQTKLKTKVVKNTSHPTFNELLQYEVPRQELVYRLLQISVWDRDMLKENNFLGAVYIKLRDLDLDKETVGWHRLGRIQMPN